MLESGSLKKLSKLVNRAASGGPGAFAFRVVADIHAVQQHRAILVGYLKRVFKPIIAVVHRQIDELERAAVVIHEDMPVGIQGETLQVVGTGDVPDAYTIPFHSLDLIVNKTFGQDRNSTINFSVKNLLDSDREVRYQSYKAEDQIFSKFSPGIGISLGYSYKF